jgi:hypothetical protein
MLPTQTWLGAVAAGQVANLLAAATACGSARVGRGGRVLARVQSARKPLALSQPRSRYRTTVCPSRRSWARTRRWP